MSSASLDSLRDLCETVRRSSATGRANRRRRKHVRERQLLLEPLELRALLSATVLPDTAPAGEAVGTASIAGFVYFDVNANGVKDGVESGLPNVAVSLEGPFHTTAISGANGFYQFTDLPAGVYTLTQLPPLGVTTGIATPGTPAQGNAEGTRLLNVNLQAGVAATDYNFGELGLDPDEISLRSLLAIPPVDPQVAPPIVVRDGYGRQMSINQLINFGSAAKGGPALQQTFSVYNPSATDTLDLSYVNTGAVPTGSFVAGKWSTASIPPQTNATFTVSMPTNMSPGSRTGTPTFYYGKHLQQRFPFNFRLTGQLTATQFVAGQSGLSVGECNAPANEAYGTTVSIGSAIQGVLGPATTFCIANQGMGTVSLGGLSAQPGSAFLISSLPALLNPGEVNQFTVQLATNTSPGVQDAALAFQYTIDGETFDYNFEVRGEVLPPNVQAVAPFKITVEDNPLPDIQGATIDLGSAPQGSEKLQKKFTITNSSDKAVDLSPLGKDGVYADAFSVTDFPGHIGGHDSRTFTVALSMAGSPHQYKAHYTFVYTFEDELVGKDYGFNVSGNVTPDLVGVGSGNGDFVTIASGNSPTDCQITTGNGKTVCTCNPNVSYVSWTATVSRVVNYAKLDSGLYPLPAGIRALVPWPAKLSAYALRPYSLQLQVTQSPPLDVLFNFVFSGWDAQNNKVGDSQYSTWELIVRPFAGNAAVGEPSASPATAATSSTSALDINGDGFVTAADVLVVIGSLNAQGPGGVASELRQPAADVNADGLVTALDCLVAIQFLNTHGPCAVSPPVALAAPSNSAGTAEGEAGASISVSSVAFVSPAQADLASPAAHLTLPTSAGLPDGGAGSEGLRDGYQPRVANDDALGLLATDLDRVLSELSTDINQAWTRKV